MSGRKPLDPATKAEHRQESLRRYAEKNRDSLREAARLRMRRLRAAAAASSSKRQQSLKTAARYRDKHREAIREADTARRARQYIEKAGAEAFDVKKDRKFLARTQRAHEGHPPPPRPRPQNRRPDLLARRGPNRPHALPHSARSAVPQTQVGRRHVSSSPEREQHIAVARPSKRRPRQRCGHRGAAAQEEAADLGFAPLPLWDTGLPSVRVCLPCSYDLDDLDGS
ncbi:hypothetical protein B0H11DRAFT_2247748 [Mycena galericulata]|nr:hypothetical protein B0H11DRAFT_2264270 [Mycena galericulata]KAJ7448461.1 hypothetical protein B0H11DRAFT_2247748 [Mycena galericulata]